ncbi:Protein PAT1 2 [Liparis tanakae]|uniref:Protein PAT1 2 n=1 Tax=Liparis tanakae TaxID=230148 RepID=A0A4Z2GEU1_9TELE|nr:Protein PAT1 2 [Liparis tanakae]
MNDTEQQKSCYISTSQEAENVSPPQWPENGDAWSDGEDGTDMDCGLLQAMAEDDEEKNVYNEETFGMDFDAQGTTEDPSSGRLEFEEPPPPPPLPLSPTPPPPTDPKPSPLPSAPSPPRQSPQYVPRPPPGQRGRFRGQRGGLGGCQMFEDPAVMRTVEGRPSLKTLDGAIVEIGNAVHHKTLEDEYMSPSFRKTQRVSGSILQDSAVVCVIDGHRGGGQHSNFLDLPYPVSSFRGRRGEPRGSFMRSQFGQRGPNQIHAAMLHPSMLPASPIFSRQPLTPRQHYNQTGGFMFPTNRPCPSSPQPLTSKMMHLRFGANSPRPSPVYSPSSNPMQHFRKSEDWDPYCNLMTAKEKEWIIRLQMIQLQSENPYHEDYYYQEFYRRKEAKMAEEELGIRSKRETPKLTTPYITKTDVYAPVVHIEGSLGQVAVSTCYSPRRAISAVHSVHTRGPLEEQQDIRQQRLEVLSKIEKLFMVLLEVEEMARMKNTVLSEAEEAKLIVKSQGKVEHIYSQLQHHNPLDSGVEFLPFLLVSKGKKLLARLFPFLKHETALKVLSIVTSNLPTLMGRDPEETLPVLYPPLRNVIGGLTFSQLIVVLNNLTSESLLTSEPLILACQNKFGLSLLYALLSQGEKLLSSGVPLEPSIGDFETWTDTIFQVAGQLSQCSLVEPLLLPSNLLTLFCRYLDKRTKRKREAVS